MSCFVRPVLGRPTRLARLSSSSVDSGMSEPGGPGRDVAVPERPARLENGEVGVVHFGFQFQRVLARFDVESDLFGLIKELLERLLGPSVDVKCLEEHLLAYLLGSRAD